MSGDGGPAFPKQSADGEWYEGMSLRDWFAGQAMQVIVAEQARRGDKMTREVFAANCYWYADAMLAEKAK